MIVNILYDNKEYKVKITNYNKSKVEYEYNNKIQKPMFSGHFLDCKFGNIFIEKKYIKDEICNTNFVLDYERNEKELNISKEYIDSLTIGSREKIFFKCCKCNTSKVNSTVFYNIYSRNEKCQFCSSGHSYPEKLFKALMDEINLIYEKRKFEWSNNRIYDAYFSNLSLCVELHGEQHYGKSFYTLGGKTHIQENANDRYKKRLAKINGIKNYIQIDCRVSNINYIKNNIIKSLSWIFDFSEVDWLKIARKCEDSLVYEVCKYWNNCDEFDRSTAKLSEKFNLDDTTIRTYLKKGNDLNWCSYDTQIEITKSAIKSNMQKRIKVKCVETGVIYTSLSDAEKYTNAKASNISRCVRKEYGFKTAGGYTWELIN